jgi:energy-coupling factor transporter ATP-binding protein EcfA2
MTKNLEVEVENLGPFQGPHKFTFYPGINMVEGPTASGKTTLVRALKLAYLPQEKSLAIFPAGGKDELDHAFVGLIPLRLEGKAHLVSMHQKYAHIKIKNGILLERHFIPVGNDLLSLGSKKLSAKAQELIENQGDKLFSQKDFPSREYKKILAVCFADYDNDLLRGLLTQESIKRFVNLFADGEPSQNAIRKTIESQLKKMLKGTKFEDIEIDKDYSIYLHSGDRVNPHSMLSGGERSMLALMLLMAGKKKFLPDFPFFVIDNATHFLDLEHLKKLKERLADVAEYVLITQKEATKGGQILIERG